MVAAELKTSSTANVSKGFSSRFNKLLDHAGFPSDNRIAYGQQRFNVAYATFKAWCGSDRMPGTYEALVQMVRELLKQVPGRHDPQAVTAWLQAGDKVPNPFARSDDIVLVELYIEISKIAKEYGIDFDSFPRDTRNVFLQHVRAMLPSEPKRSDEGLQLDSATVSAVVGMLRMAGVRT